MVHAVEVLEPAAGQGVAKMADGAAPVSGHGAGGDADGGLSTDERGREPRVSGAWALICLGALSLPSKFLLKGARPMRMNTPRPEPRWLIAAGQTQE